jgi:hypothetical protein
MARKETVTRLVIIFGFILLVLTLFEYLSSTFSITIDPVLSYWIQIIYFVSIMIFLLLLVIYLELLNR